MQGMCGGVWNDRKPRKTTTKFKQEIGVMNSGCMGSAEECEKVMWWMIKQRDDIQKMKTT